MNLAQSPPADPAGPSGTVEGALARALDLLGTAPELAIEQAREILQVLPGHPQAQLVLGMGQRAAGLLDPALQTLEDLAVRQPRAAAVFAALGMVQADRGQEDAALAALRRAVELKPDHADAWRALGDLYTQRGDTAGADAAYAAHIRAATHDPRLLTAAAALVANDIPVAESLLREHLRKYPTDVAALRMLAEVAARLRRYPDAVVLLLRCLELAPGFDAARQNLVLVLNRQNRFPEALEQIEHLLRLEPRNPGYRNLRATVLARIGDHAESIRIYADILASQPRLAGIWMNYGHALATAGRNEDGVAAYRHCIEIEPNCGEAYWSLANLKTFRFAPSEIASMEGQLRRSDLTTDERLHFHFSIGKAQEDAKRYEESFLHYAHGNRLRRSIIQYDADANHEDVVRSKELLTPAFFAERSHYGVPDRDPIFIVGLPRAGSTLLEQILASHSTVEGTMEHPDIMIFSARLGAPNRRAGGPGYPGVLADMTLEQSRALGEQYLEHTRLQRKTDRPLFIDKMPNNFLHIGLIRLILPNAKIIDARRHPMACCFSGFKQHFARGQHFTYSLEEIGRYYRDYVELMQHFDAVLPGTVHRVIYEELVDDTEAGVRRLLDYCELPFEESCLRFYENARSVRTASAQQVRKPIFRDGIDQWKHFSPWLGPLESALGPVLEAYPRAPSPQVLSSISGKK